MSSLVYLGFSELIFHHEGCENMGRIFVVIWYNEIFGSRLQICLTDDGSILRDATGKMYGFERRQ